MYNLQEEIRSIPWVIPYLMFLSKGFACKAENNEERLLQFYQQIQHLRIDRWKTEILNNPGSVKHRTEEGIRAIRRHVVFWHRPNQEPFARHSDLGKSLQFCETCLEGPQDLISRLIATEAGKPDTILGVHIDAIVTLDCITAHNVPTYSIVVRICPEQWFPNWINDDQNLLGRLCQRRIPIQSKQVAHDTDRYLM